ncbi:MAG: hypothetical protein L6V88_02935 [Anaerotruncus sp.]|nr:MAG: hypothetical protein L6V88_02935 [Anaerotruncus sp.]
MTLIRGKNSKTLCSTTAAQCLSFRTTDIFINKLATSIIELTPHGINKYIGNYDEYISKREETAEPQKAKRRRSKIITSFKRSAKAHCAKLKTSVSRLEGQIEDLEDEIALLEERLNCNPPYEEFLKISAELQQKNPSNAILLMKIGLKKIGAAYRAFRRIIRILN